MEATGMNTSKKTCSFLTEDAAPKKTENFTCVYRKKTVMATPSFGARGRRCLINFKES